MKQIPDAANRVWTQPNNSDVTGSLFATKNADLTDNFGKLRVGKRLVLNTSSIDTSDIGGPPSAFIEYNPSGSTEIFAIAGVNIINSPIGYPSQTPFAASVNAPVAAIANFGDLEIFQGNLYATTDTKLCKLTTGTTWSTPDVSSLTASVHLLKTYGGRLYITNANCKIISWDGSSMTTTGQFSLDLSSGGMSAIANTISFVKAASNRIWIGTINQLGGKCYIYEWDGTSVSPTKSYLMETSAVLSCVIKDDIPYVIDEYGRLLSWTGGTFNEIARLNRRRDKLFYDPLDSSNQRFVHPNGMAIIKNKVNMLIDTRFYESSAAVGETTPAGIWEYDPNIGLYHKHSFGLTHAADTIVDYGSARISTPGALAEMNYPTTATNRDGTFVAGTMYYTDATNTASGVFYDNSIDTLQKYGSIILPKIEATDGSVYNLPSIQSMWDSFFTIYRKLLNATDRIIPKYRTEEQDPVEATITWTSTTTFTVSDSSVTLANYWTVGTGGEVEIMQGIGAGKCAHITKVVSTAGVSTVTLDETFVSASGTAKARFQNWKKISVISPNNQAFNSDTISKPSTWIQFKVCMLFTGRNEIERFIITNSNSTPAK